MQMLIWPMMLTKKKKKSITGFVFTLGRTTVSWASNQQKIVALSTKKAKCVASTEAVNEMI